MEKALNDRDQWSKAKLNLGWTKTKGPSIIIDNGIPIQSPKELARIMNVKYLSKIAKLHREIPKNTGDPLKNFKKITKNKFL